VADRIGLQLLVAAGVVFAFEGLLLGGDVVLGGRADEFIHFEHGAADEAGDSAAARFSFTGFVAEVFDGAHYQRDRDDDEHREGRDQEEEDLEGHFLI
jgi:hypothetical protein